MRWIIHLSLRQDFQMKGIVAAIIAIAVLWMADIELNDARYSEATGRAILSLIGK